MLREGDVLTCSGRPVRTFDTAAKYYHKFRIRFPSSEYNYEDVALASLFVACKVEDTIKKSREILCAAHNLRQPHDNKTPDDKVRLLYPRLLFPADMFFQTFEAPSRFTVGLERHILETIGFDFRVQYPQKLLIKKIRKMFPPSDSEGSYSGKDFLQTGYDMSVDLYKTFAPIKQCTSTLVQALLELTALLLGVAPDKINNIKDSASHTDRACVYETLLDLLDLYVQFPKLTKIGSRFDLNKLMDVKIDINKMASEEGYQRYNKWCDQCLQEAPEPHSATPGSATSPATNNSFSGSGSVRRKGAVNDGTLRFVFDAEAARKERDLVSEHFNDEWEEHEVEVEEPIREPEPRHSNSGRNSYPHRSHGHNHNDHGWGPYHRGRHGHHSDRPKGRKGHGYY